MVPVSEFAVTGPWAEVWRWCRTVLRCRRLVVRFPLSHEHRTDGQPPVRRAAAGGCPEVRRRLLLGSGPQEVAPGRRAVAGPTDGACASKRTEPRLPRSAGGHVGVPGSPRTGSVPAGRRRNAGDSKMILLSVMRSGATDPVVPGAASERRRAAQERKWGRRSRGTGGPVRGGRLCPPADRPANTVHEDVGVASALGVGRSECSTPACAPGVARAPSVPDGL